MKTNCAYCGKEIDRRPCIINRNSRCYCNASHQLKYEYANGIRDRYKTGIKAREVSQERMREHNWLNTKQARDKLRESIRTPQSREKARLAKLGSKNAMYGKRPSNYIDGKKSYGITYDRSWYRLKKLIKIRDNFTCQACNMIEDESFIVFNQPLQVHHLIPYRMCKEHKSNNLITLCCKCHGLCERQDILLLKGV